jgi:hypothetical protein
MTLNENSVHIWMPEAHAFNPSYSGGLWFEASLSK